MASSRTKQTLPAQWVQLKFAIIMIRNKLPGRSDCACTRKSQRAKCLGAPSTRLSSVPVCFVHVRSVFLILLMLTVITHDWHCIDGFWPEDTRMCRLFVSKFCTAVSMHNYTDAHAHWNGIIENAHQQKECSYTSCIMIRVRHPHKDQYQYH